MADRPFRVTLLAVFYAFASLVPLALCFSSVIWTGSLYVGLICSVAAGMLSVCSLAIAVGLFFAQLYAWRFFAAQPWLDGQYFQSEEVKKFFDVKG